MAEDKTTPETGEDEKAEDKTSASNLVKEAEKQADRIEAGNKKYEELVKREEAAKVKEKLGGAADAGQAPTEKKEETPLEYKERIMRGEESAPAT